MRSSFDPQNGFGRAPRLFINVTQEIIRESCRRNSNHCMIAEALKKAHPELSHISVDIQTIRASDKKKRERYVWLTPRAGQGGIVKFDLGKNVEPFGFHCRDGQVTAMSESSSKRGANKKRKKVSMRTSRGGTRTTVPEKVGGRTPPRSIGQRRSFGLRQLKY
jgi:hypothetical protein